MTMNSLIENFIAYIFFWFRTNIRCWTRWWLSFALALFHIYVSYGIGRVTYLLKQNEGILCPKYANTYMLMSAKSSDHVTKITLAKHVHRAWKRNYCMKQVCICDVKESKFHFIVSLLASASFGTFGSTFSTFETTLFGEGSLMRVHYPKCKYGPYC